MKREDLCKRSSISIFAAAGAAMFGLGDPSTAWAADRLKPLADCRAIADPVARLACYDKEVDGLKRSVDNKEVTIVDKEQIKETRRGLFGFNIGRLPLFGRKDGANSGDEKDDEENVLLTKITSARPISYGKWRFVVEGGAVWETTEPDALVRDPKAGMSVELKKAALGSYFAKINGGRAVRAQRVN